MCLIACLVFNVARGADWPMLGRDETRNAVSPEKNPPLEWDVKNGKNIKWRAPIETWTASTPVVANGCVWIGTSDRERRDQKAVRAAGVLACHREGDGKPLYQHVSFVRTGPTARRIHFGLKASLLIEGDRLWYVNSGAETLCLDIAPLRKEGGQARLLWSLDLMDELGVLPIGDVMGEFGMCSIPASLGDFIYVITGNGRGFGSDVPSPFAPALVCLGKHTDAVFVTTPHDIVARMFELAKVRKSDVVVDLGSGDGRYVIAAAKQYGCKAIGYEIDARLVAQSRELVAKESLQDLARIEHKDIFTLDLSGADVITVFLYPRLMERLIPQFDKLKPGSRIVSHQFEMPGIKPDQEIHLESKETGEKHRVLLWTTPLKKQ